MRKTLAQKRFEKWLRGSRKHIHFISLSRDGYNGEYHDGSADIACDAYNAGYRSGKKITKPEEGH